MSWVGSDLALQTVIARPTAETGPGTRWPETRWFALQLHENVHDADIHSRLQETRPTER
jgi:hypothetical protein